MHYLFLDIPLPTICFIILIKVGATGLFWGKVTRTYDSDAIPVFIVHDEDVFREAEASVS